METITHGFLDELIDFAPQDGGASESVGKLQREGTVAAFNMLVHNRCAYLADEVGMGKTYVALGVMSLLRYFNPHTRVIIIAPRQNIQEKWTKELKNFVRNNWKIIDNRVKSLESTPVWEPVVCGNLPTFAHEALLNQDRDFFLRMTSFSLRSKQIEDRVRSRNRLVESIPWLRKHHIDTSSHDIFLETYAVALNGAIPDADLVIVDEAHNLKHGFGENVSNRNRVMGLAFGHESGVKYQRDWFKSKAKRVLFLSATPFEDDFAAIHRQLQIFGFGDLTLVEPNSDEGPSVSALSDPEADFVLKRNVVARLLIRRTSGLSIAGKTYTKNMCRREWRRGGLKTFDEPIRIEDAKTRLIIALMQKKVSEVLQTEKFNNSFQVGMLSSFESFAQDIDTVMHHGAEDVQESLSYEKNDRRATFDGLEQQLNLSQKEKEGIDSNAVVQVARSFEKKFHRRLPHPKLDRVAETQKDAFQTGEKVLIFVRRVATVSELAGKLNEEYNKWIRERMEAFLPYLREDIGEIFQRYRNVHQRKRLNLSEKPSAIRLNGEEIEEESEAIDDQERVGLDLDNDAGGVSSFFEWFFRGTGPDGILSGAAFQKNRLSSIASVYSTLFEDNYVASLLNVEPTDTFNHLQSFLGLSTDECNKQLREIAYSYYSERSSQKQRYPRLYIFEAYQVAALTLISETTTDPSKKATIVLQEQYPDFTLSREDAIPSGFPSAEMQLVTKTIFTQLRNNPNLCEQLWPEDQLSDFRATFRRREQRRELFSALARLGAAYIDLYLLGIKQIGSFELRQPDDQTASDLATEYVDLLNRQQHQSGIHAFYELSQTAKTFNTLVAVNFPDLEQQKLSTLARYFGTILGQQVPVGGVFGQVIKRIVSQFRMPGYPLVLISTDVLQEGEDLHTFCKKVIHYGIAWTPSSIEQRTGRIDRIGGLAQRNLDRCLTEPDGKELIQVFYPHLRDTVELLQVRRVLRRLNTFMELIHQDLHHTVSDETSINANSAVHEEEEDIPQIKKPLKSAFEIKEYWLSGSLDASDVRIPEWEAKLAHFQYLCKQLFDAYAIERSPPRRDHEFEGRVHFVDAQGRHDSYLKVAVSNAHPFTIRLKSHVAGDQTLIQCESHVMDLDLSNEENMNVMTKAIKGFDTTKICLEPRITRWLDGVFIRLEVLFDPDLTQPNDLLHLFDSVVPTSAHLHDRLKVLLNDANHLAPGTTPKPKPTPKPKANGAKKPKATPKPKTSDPKKGLTINYEPDVDGLAPVREGSILCQVIERLDKGATVADLRTVCIKKDGSLWDVKSILVLLKWDVKTKGYGLKTIWNSDETLATYHLLTL